MGAKKNLAALGCITLLAGGVLPTCAPAAPREAIPRIYLAFRASLLPDPVPAFPGIGERIVRAPGPPAQRDILGWLEARTALRPARTIVDFRPMPTSNLRLSLGTRFYSGYSADGTSPGAEAALNFNPRGNNRPAALRDGFDRFAPIALIGFERAIGGGWRAGVDAGAMLGRAVSVVPNVDRPGGISGAQTPHADPLNPVGAVTLNYAF